MKTLIRYSRRLVVSYCGLIITLTFFMVSSPVLAQDDSDPYPVGPAPDGVADLVEIKDGETSERPTKQEPRPMTTDLNPYGSILPDPGPAVPKLLAELGLEPLPETPTQPQLPVAMPDLIVEDIWSTTSPLQAGQEENVTFRVRNQGTANISTTFYIRFFLDGVSKATWSSGGLLAGQALQASTTVTVNSAGPHQVEIVVDFLDHIVESDESNNIRTETWGWTSLVDLIVEDIWSTTTPLQAGQEENVTFRVRNQGTANISTTFYIRFFLDGVSKATWSSGGLLAGQALQASATVTVDSAGSHQVKIEVDFDDRIVESDESNNIRTETWFWETSPVDLIVEDIWPTTNPLQAGEVEEIIYRIKNVGTAAVPVDFLSHLFIDGSSAGAVSISGLAAGASVDHSIEVTVEIPGSHEVEVIVDLARVVPEINENNNSLVESWNWQEGPVDLIVTDILSTTSPLQAGMVENVSFEVKNEGIVGTPATFHAMLLVDGVPVGEKTFSGIDAGSTLAADVELQLNEPGLHELIVIVDHTNLVPETNEGNNERVERWTWQSSPIDLVVDDIWPTTEPLEAGSVETIKLQIRNQGTEAVKGIFDTRLSIGDIYSGTIQTDGLAAGAAAVKTFDIRINDPGVHEVRVIVDSAGVVVEGDEANNEWLESWEWTGEKWYQQVLPLILR